MTRQAIHDGLKDQHRNAIIQVLAAHPRIDRAILFGSRAMGTYSSASDIDIALVGDALDATDLARLSGQMEELNVPQQVDLLLHRSIQSPELLEHIEKHGVVVWEAPRSQNQNSPIGWRLVPIGKLGRVVTGRTPPGDEDGHFGPGIPFLTPSDLVGSRSVESTARTLSPAGASRLAKCLIKRGVAVSCIGWQMGKSAWIKAPTITNQQINSIEIDTKTADGLFVFYACSAKRSQFFNLGAGGSRTPILNKSGFESVQLLLPPLPEQRRIAAVLGALDDKIELNRRMNQTLEAMAQALFKSWFIDFDGHTDLVDSELGPIPRGWQWLALPDAIQVNPSRRLSKGTAAPYLDMSNMPVSGHRPVDWTEREFGSGVKFMNGDTLVARITPCLENGKTAFVDFLAPGEVAWGSTEYIVLKPRPPLPDAYAYYLARSEPFRAFAIQNMTGSSGRQRVPAECFAKYMIPAPPPETCRAFGMAAEPLMHRISAASDQSRTLAALRDTLLPKLISGEIRVPDIEGLVEEAV